MMLGNTLNILGSTMIWWSDAACTLVPRSDRKQYRARRPTYGLHRKRAIAGIPRRVAVIRSSRRCAPRLVAKPGIFKMGNKLIVHPALKAQLMHHFNQ